MKITIGIEDDLLDAIGWMDTIFDIVCDKYDGFGSVACAVEEIKFFLNRVYEVADNKRIIKKDKLRKKEIKREQLPDRQRVLTLEEKAGMTDEEVFAAEYGLRASFAISNYWKSVFEETYKHTPALPDYDWMLEECREILHDSPV